MITLNTTIIFPSFDFNKFTKPVDSLTSSLSKKIAPYLPSSPSDIKWYENRHFLVATGLFILYLVVGHFFTSKRNALQTTPQDLAHLKDRAKTRSTLELVASISEYMPNVAAIGGGAFFALTLGRPPLVSGIITRIYFLVRSALINHFTQRLDNSKRDAVENLIDIVAVYSYHTIAKNSKLLKQSNVDFCLPGSFLICYIAQKVSKICKIYVHSKKDSQLKIRDPIKEKKQLDAENNAIAPIFVSSLYLSAMQILKSYLIFSSNAYILKFRKGIEYAILLVGIIVLEKTLAKYINSIDVIDVENDKKNTVLENKIYLFSLFFSSCILEGAGSVMECIYKSKSHYLGWSLISRIIYTHIAHNLYSSLSKAWQTHKN